MQTTLAEITLWASTSELDERFAQLFDDDYEGFEHDLLSACDDLKLLEFASNRNSTKRQFFGYALVQRLVSHLYLPSNLPYSFSRFEGLISLDQYRTNELKRIEHMYELCCVVEKMRNSELEEIANLGNMILDYRHDRLFPDADATKLLRLLNYQIEQSLKPGVTAYTYRLCETCNDGFKSWLLSGVECDVRKCPFCCLGIIYPQKTGKNKA
jgi:hypothetical protein